MATRVRIEKQKHEVQSEPVGDSTLPPPPERGGSNQKKQKNYSLMMEIRKKQEDHASRTANKIPSQDRTSASRIVRKYQGLTS